MNPKQPMVLHYCGLFNPYHLVHTRALRETKQWIDSNTDYRVKSGVIKLLSDENVKANLTSDDVFIPYEGRVALCQLSLNEPWVSIEDQPQTALLPRSSLKAVKHVSDATVGVLIGANQAISEAGEILHTQSGQMTIIIGTKGMSRSRKQAFDRNKGRLDLNETIVVPIELDNVKSIDIRHELRKCYNASPGLQARTLSSIVKNGWLNNMQVDFLFDNFYKVIKDGTNDISAVHPKSSRPPQPGPRLVVLYMFGCFNPIHAKHIELLVKVKRWLKINTMYTVESAYLALTGDDNAKKKANSSGGMWISFENRKKLCEVASAKLDWIKVFPYIASSQINGIKQLRTFLNRPNVIVGSVCGSDRGITSNGAIISYKDYRNIFGVVVGRMPMSVREQEDFRKKTGYHQNCYAIPDILEDVSSTDIRRSIVRSIGAPENTCATIFRDFVESEWMCQEEAEYIHENTFTVCQFV